VRFPLRAGSKSGGVARRGVGPHLDRLANAEMAGREARRGHRGREEGEARFQEWSDFLCLPEICRGNDNLFQSADVSTLDNTHSGIERGACRARGLWLCCIMYLSRCRSNAKLAIHLTGRIHAIGVRATCWLKACCAGHLHGTAADRLLDHCLGRFNAGAQQRTKLSDVLYANRSKPPAAKAQVARLRRQGDGAAGCPVPLRVRNVYKFLQPCRSPLASACALVCPAISLTHDAGETSPCNQASIFPCSSLRSYAFVMVGACTLHPSLRSCCQLGPCVVGLPRRFSSRDSHSSFLLAPQPFVGVEQASASIEEKTA
jgi:hypothetical protein